MDIVLELFDTYLFDRIYSTLLPVSGPLSLKQAGQDVVSQYSYQPASQILGFPPTEWAYRSAWPRDNIYRQALSLFLITW